MSTKRSYGTLEFTKNVKKTPPVTTTKQREIERELINNNMYSNSDDDSDSNSSIDDEDEEDEEESYEKRTKKNPPRKVIKKNNNRTTTTSKKQVKKSNVSSKINISDEEIEEDDEEDCYLSTASFYSSKTTNIKGFQHTLSEIYFQDEGKEQVIYKIYAQAITPYRPKKASERICSIHITGGSGIGKSETPKQIASFLGVGPGTKYPNQYIEISMSKYSDESHAVGITGVAGGLLGHNNKDIVERFIQSSKQVVQGEDNPFVVVIFDEICKAHSAFMNGLNPLLSDGSFANVKEERYTIPNGTLLIIFWTSNFAQNLINPNADPEKSIEYVYDLMLEKGFDNCDIARMGGDPVIYNPISRDDMYTIIEKKGNSRISLHPFSRKYGIPVYNHHGDILISLLEEDAHCPIQNNILIKNIIKAYKVELGVRHPLEKYKTEIDTLLTTAMTISDLYLDTEEEENISNPISKKRNINNNNNNKKNPIYWCRHIKITMNDRMNRELFLEQHTDISYAIRQNFKNKSNFNLVFDSKEEEVILEYIVLKFTKDNEILHAYRILRPVLDDAIKNHNDSSSVDDNFNESNQRNPVSAYSNNNNIKYQLEQQQQRIDDNKEIDLLRSKYNSFESKLDKLLEDNKTVASIPTTTTTTPNTQTQISTPTTNSTTITRNEYNDMIVKFSKLEQHVYRNQTHLKTLMEFRKETTKFISSCEDKKIKK